ncbi:MAG: ribonuclease H-like domain-containing protein [Elusimicrobia bacterium]|nr:ribonuclease H-like domain-containing protein [Elusimicrobiota bacterium]
MGDPLIRAYIDIETDEGRRLTVVGVFRPDRGCRQWVRPNFSRMELLNFLSGVECLMSYNGARFDLPVLKDQLRVDLDSMFSHRDLMLDCWAHDLKGGLKKVERQLGIHRDSEGIDGLAAIRLWHASRRGEPDALETLLRYNREDVENLEALALKLGVVMADVAVLSGGKQCP